MINHKGFNEKFNFFKKRYFLAFLSGIFLILPFSPFPFFLSFIVFVALIPLFGAIYKSSTKNAFFAGLITGSIFFLGNLYWIIIAMNRYGGVDYLLALGILIFFSLFLGSFVALFSSIISFLIRKKIPLFFAAPFTWVGMEYILSFILSGFPWCLLGYTQSRWPLFIQFADITGVYGVSFIIVIINTVIFEILLSITKKRRLPLLSIGITIILLIFIFSYGKVKLSENFSAGKRLKIGVAQGNIPQDMKWNKEMIEMTLDIYEGMTKNLAREGADIVIWPETAAPFYFCEPTPYREKVLNIAKKNRIFLLFGAPYYEVKNKETFYYNSCFLVSPNGDIIGRYDKIHLVPYGEYVPLKRYFPFLGKVSSEIGDFRSGKKIKNLYGDDFIIGVLICFEIIFPDLVRRFVKNGAQLLVTITNDAWFGKTTAPYQHFDKAIFRAVENRVYLIRSANTGISGVIGPKGRVVISTPIFQKRLFIKEISFYNHSHLSFYTKYGDIFSRIILIITALLFIISLLKRR